MLFFTVLTINSSLQLRDKSNNPFSWVIYNNSVTVESISSFLCGFVIYKGKRKNLAPIRLKKVRGNSVSTQNPKWPPSALLEINFWMLCPTMLCNICFLGYFGPRKSYLMSFWWFGLLLTFKSKMAADINSGKYIFLMSSYSLHNSFECMFCLYEVELWLVKNKFSPHTSPKKAA